MFCLKTERNIFDFMKPRKPITTTKIKCKPHVKAYLEVNFGVPVMIPEDHPLSTLVNSQLTKENPRFNKTIVYEEFTEIGITKETFRFDGHTINENSTQNFNTAVEKFMKLILRTNIDSLLIAQTSQADWEEKCNDLLDRMRSAGTSVISVTEINDLKKDLQNYRLSIKKAIEIACKNHLKIDMEVIGYETVKKDYYRYRQRKFLRQTSPANETKFLRQMSLALNFNQNGNS